MDKEEREKLKKWVHDAYYDSFGSHMAELFGFTDPKPLDEDHLPKGFGEGKKITVTDRIIDVEK